MQTKTHKQSFILIWLCAIIFFLILLSSNFFVKAETENGEIDQTIEVIDEITNEEEPEEPVVLNGLCADPEDGQIAYYKDGIIDTSHTGFEQLADGSDDIWYYVESGVVTGNRNDIVSENLNGVIGWYLVKESRFSEETTVAQNANGWWYVKNGKVDFKYNGFEKNESGWWYLENGKVTFKKSDILQGVANTDPEEEGEEGWWLVRQSKVVNETTLEQNAYGWWFVNEGQVDFSYTGMKQNDKGWWYIKEGKLDFKYNGFAKNEYGWWYLEKGNVSFKKNDILKGEANTDPEAEGEDAWWLIQGSKVVNETTIAQNAYGWWYVKEGKVDFNHTGVDQNENGWWRVVNGKVDFNCNSVEQNENGWWCIHNGKVDFGYTGLAQNAYGWWYILNGKVDFTFNGLAYYRGNWYYMEDGKLNWNYNGTVSIPGYRKSYNVKNGKVSGGLIPPTAELAQKADQILQRLGYDLDKEGQDLHKAFNWCVMSYQVYTTGGDKGTAYYATYGMNNHRGNCYCMAASFVVLARELGYEAYEISGYIAGTYIHSWSEVKIGNKFYVFDPDFVVDQGRNGYQISYGQSGTWRYTDYYTMYN